MAGVCTKCGGKLIKVEKPSVKDEFAKICESCGKWHYIIKK